MIFETKHSELKTINEKVGIRLIKLRKISRNTLVNFN